MRCYHTMDRNIFRTELKQLNCMRVSRSGYRKCLIQNVLKDFFACVEVIPRYKQPSKMITKMLNCQVIREITRMFLRPVDKNFANLSFETKCQDTHEELFLFDSIDRRKRLKCRRTRFEHGETFFILSAFTLDIVTRQTLTRLN